MKYSPVFLLAVFLLFSCAGRTPEEVYPEAGVSALLENALENHGSFFSIKSRAAVSINSPEGDMFFDQVTLARRPDLLKVFLLAPMGETLARIVSDGSSVRMKTRGEEIVFDDAGDFRISYLYPGLPSRLRMSDLVRFLLGDVPFPLPPGGYSSRLKENGREILFTFSGARRVEVTVDPGRNVVSGVDYEFPDGAAASVSFSGFRKLPAGGYFPSRLVFVAGGRSLKVNYTDDLRVNSPVDPSLFGSL